MIGNHGTLILLVLQVSAIGGRLAVLRGKVSSYFGSYQERQLMCVSEDDGAGLVWNGNLDWIYAPYAFNDRASQTAFSNPAPHAKSVLDCKMNGHEPCTSSWTILNWTMTNSIAFPMGPIYDNRWESLREYNNFHNYNTYRQMHEVAQTNSMAFSIRASTDAHFLFCDSEQYDRDLCYWIIIGGWTNTKSVIRKCPRGVPSPTAGSKPECELERATHIHSPLSSTEWRTFVLSWDASTRRLTLYDPDDAILTFTDLDEPVNRNRNNFLVFMKSPVPMLFRPHIYSFLYTTELTSTFTSNRLNLNNADFCLEMLVGLCSKCLMTIWLIDASGESDAYQLDVVKGSKVTSAHGLPGWQYVRLTKKVTFDLQDGIRIKLSPSMSGPTDRPLWAVADIRVCPPMGAVRYGVMTATQDYYNGNYHWTNVTCQKLSSSSYGSSVVTALGVPTADVKFDDLDCPQGMVGPYCSISCSNDLRTSADCIGTVICEEGYCTCPPGFSGNDCRSTCDVNHYGPGCRETCGSCRDGMCNWKTGVCIYGCDNSRRYNLAPFCKAGLDPVPRPEIDFLNETTIRANVAAREIYKEVDAIYVFEIRKEVDSTVHSIEKARKVEKNVTKFVAFVDDLRPGTKYLIKCVLYVGNNNDLIDGQWTNFTTRCTPITEFPVSIDETRVTLRSTENQASAYSCPPSWYHCVLENADTETVIYYGSLPSFTWSFSNLTPYTPYKLTILKGNATLSSQVFRTLEGAPPRVTNLQKTVSNWELTLQWDPIQFVNGRLRHYEVTLEVESFQGCKDLNTWPRWNNTIVRTTNSTRIVFPNLQPYVNYVAKVCACTSKRGPESSVKFRTEQTGIPTSILSSLRFGNFTLHWSTPVDCTTITGPIPATKIIIDGVSESVKHFHDVRQTRYHHYDLGRDMYGSEEFRARIYPLRAYHQPHNESGYLELFFQTPSLPPPEVRNFTIFETDLKNMRTSMRWQKPKPPLNGVIQHYVVCACDSSCHTLRNVLPNETCEVWKDYLCATVDQPDRRFGRIGVAAVNANVTAVGAMVYQSITRMEIEPDAPGNLQVHLLAKGVANLTWSHPWINRGHLEQFSIRVRMLSTRLKRPIEPTERQRIYGIKIPCYRSAYHEALRLSPSSSYEISIHAETNTYTRGKVSTVNVNTPLAIAFNGELTSEVNNDDSTILLHIPALLSDTRNSLMSVIVRSSHSCEQHAQLSRELRELVGIGASECAWLADHFPPENYAAKAFRVGDNRRPLVHGESYVIAIIVEAEEGSIMLAKTTSIRIGGHTRGNDVAWLVPSFMFVGLALAAYYFYRRKKRSSIKKKRRETEIMQDNRRMSAVTNSKQPHVQSASHSLESLPPITATVLPLPPTEKAEKRTRSHPVAVQDFRDYVKKAMESGLLDKQYATFPRGQTRPWDYGKLPQNKPKNRYGNLIAYDASRVVLRKLPDDPYSDYINANHIKGYKKEKCYIATQGPKPTTVIDFWRMIWQENVLVICMLANLIESGKAKCEQYWPDIGKKKKYGDVIVSNVKHNVFADYTLRTLQATCGEETRQIEHLHYTAWPDHGVPLYTYSVVAYLKRLLATPSGDGPIVVHCSAGVGRTGTIILCHLCLRRAAEEEVIDVFAETEAIRSQRANLVDNRQQYLLAHLAIVECLLSFPTALPCNESLPTKIRELKKQLTVEQQRLQSSAWQDEALRPQTMQSVLSERNIAKNRFPELVSANVSRLYLKRYPPTDEDSDYISAVYVNGVRVQNQHVAAQLPLPSTFNDFWRMIVEFKVELIIMLQRPDPNDPTCCPIVPSSEFNPTPYINLTFKESATLEQYSTERLLLVDNSEQPAREQHVTMLCLDTWRPGRNQVPPNVASMVNLWQVAERIPRGEGPAVVLCHDGVTGCGLYLAMSFLLERIAVEGECDVSQAIRAIRTSRPDFVQSLEQMEYLCDAALTYLEYFQTYANFT